MKLAELRKDETEDLIVVKANVLAEHVRAVEREGIPVEKVVRLAFAEVHEKLLKEAIVGALEKPLPKIPKTQTASSTHGQVQRKKIITSSGIVVDMERAELLRSQGKTLRQIAYDLGVSYGVLCSVTDDAFRNRLQAKAEPKVVWVSDKEKEEPLATQGSRGRPTSTFDVQLAKKLREQGLTIAEVAKKVGVSYSTLRRRFAGTKFLERQKGKKRKKAITIKKKQKGVPKKLRNTSTVWTPEQILKLEAFYNDSRNHYKSGLVRGDKLGKFARSIGRSPGSVSVKISELGLSSRKVYGSRRKHAPDKVIKKTKQKRFVQLPTNVDIEVTKSVVEDMIDGRELRQLNAIVLGIDSEDGWLKFVEEFILKSKQIAEYFDVPDKFYVVRSNKGGLATIGYKQSLFGRMKR